jgi:hypothetical protein
LTDAEIRAVYGRRVTITRKGGWVLVHLDSPAPGLRDYRTSRFDPVAHALRHRGAQHKVVLFGSAPLGPAHGSGE